MRDDISKITAAIHGDFVHSISTTPTVILHESQGPSPVRVQSKVEIVDQDSVAILRISLESDREVRIQSIILGGDPIEAEPHNAPISCELFTWCADIGRTLIPLKGRTRAVLSSCEIRDDGFFKGDGGRFIIPPYLAAIHCLRGWFGIGTLGIPDSEQGLEILIEDRQLFIPFHFHGSLQLQPNEPYHLPPLLFCATRTQDEVMNLYLKHLEACNLRHIPEQWETFWSGPLYCTIGDQIYTTMLQEGLASEIGCENAIGQAFTDRMLDLMERKGLPCRLLVFDAGWMRNMALFDIHESRFPDFSGYIRNLRKKGIHSILWYAPYNADFFMTGPCRMIYDDHPDWLVKNRSGETLPLLDFTHPEVREFVASRIRFMLSDEPGCIGADGLKVDFYYHMPPPGSTFHDTSWGTGEKMQYKVLKLIYDAAKSAKQHCYIEGSSSNPLFNDTQDACRLNDDVTDRFSTYENRAWICSVSGCNPMDTDDWWSYRDYFVRLTLRKCVFGIPALYAIEYRGEQGHLLLGYSGVAPGGYPVPIEESEYRRLRAILQVYMHCPIDVSHKVFVDRDHSEHKRWFTAGKLAGQPACQVLAEGLALASYQEGSIRVAAIHSLTVRVPIPRRAHGIRVLRIEGGESTTKEEVDFCRHLSATSSLEFDAEDAGNHGTLYEIQYEIVE